jgi:uncharacterized protein
MNTTHASAHTTVVAASSRPALLAALVAGVLFGFGLALSTMVQPEVVLSFLLWQDMGLTLVMGGAVLVALLNFKVVPRLRARALLNQPFDQRAVAWNRDTALGAALFGAGWGLSGVCPGPAIAGLGTGNWNLLWALAGIALGALLQGWLADRKTR